MILERKDGALLDKVDELITETKDYPAQWVKPSIDLRELANLRRQGWNNSDLARRYKRDRSTIVKLLERIEREGPDHECT